MELHFASAGSPASTPSPGGSLKGIQQCNELGLSAIELEWVQRVPKNEEHMQKIKVIAEEHNIYLTVHAPYFVNLNAKEPEKLAASKVRIWDSLAMAQLCGAKSVCVHPAFYLKMNPAIVLQNVLEATEEIMSKKQELFPDVNLAYETMGKITQFGTLEEVLILSKKFNIYPTVDFAHIHARSNGKFNSKSEWNELLDMYEHYLGKDSLQTMHIHYSGIEYSEKGERKHLPLLESDANWQEFLEVLITRNVGGSIVIESPIQEVDTLFLKEQYTMMMSQ